MITRLKNSVVPNILCFCLAVYLFNISVDIPDRKSESFRENLTYNDQESFVEFFVEKILGYENAFPEYDDVDREEESSVSNGFHFFFYEAFDLNVNNNIAFRQGSKTYHYLFLSTSTPYLEVSSPPPDFNV